MLRNAFLFLSRRPHLRRWMETSPLAARLTRRFIAGLTLDEGLSVCRRLNSEHIAASLDHLGELVHSAKEAAAACNDYLIALDCIAALGLHASISVKLSQLGLDFDESDCRANVHKLAERAKYIGTLVEIDMEASKYIDRTLAIAVEAHDAFGSVRAVIQAYLRRSAADVAMLCERRLPVRLVKGAYNEPHSIAYSRKREVDENYLVLTRALFDGGVEPAIASHDEHMIESAAAYARERAIAPERFEFQMLYGIRRDLQQNLIARGYRLRLYVPYGAAWYPYFMRRLAERPANVLFLARQLVRR